MRQLVLAVALCAFGCNVKFPSETKIEDLRILNVALEPPEIPILRPGVTATTADDLVGLILTEPNTTAVRMTALVAHPDLDAEIENQFYACPPAFRALPCALNRRVSLATGTASTTEFQPVPLLIDELIGSEDPEGVFRQLAGDPRDVLNGLYAHLILRAEVVASSMEVDTRVLDGEKRLVIFDPSLVLVAIREARRLAETGELPMVEGLDLPTLCTRASEDDIAALREFLRRRTPNRSPAFLAIEVRVGSSSVALPIDGPIELEPGESVELSGLAGAFDRENYQLIDDNCQLIDQVETLVWSWFTNVGSLSSGLTIDGEAEEEDQRRTVYTAPRAFEGDMMRARIWSVLRDGRGGSRHRAIDVLIRR